MSLRPFHLAFTVNDLVQAEAFYGGQLGCPVGRRCDSWIDFDFFGHQITAHLDHEPETVTKNAVDGDQVPKRHFGIILEWEDWQTLAKRLEQTDAQFIIKPKVRFKGQVGEQATMFVTDPAGNALEFKAFKEDRAIFQA
ncbi:MAG: VOC family protein [Pseudomonadota bacterium]